MQTDYSKRAKVHFAEGRLDHALIDLRNSTDEGFKAEVLARKESADCYRKAKMCERVGENATRKEDYDGVIRAYTKAIDLHRSVQITQLYDKINSLTVNSHIRDTSFCYISRAKAYFEKKDYDSAIADSEKATGFRTAASCLESLAYLEKGDYDAVIKICDREDWWHLYPIAAQAWLKKGNYPFAIEKCRKAIKAARKDENLQVCAWAHFILGKARFFDGKRVFAKKDCEKALEEVAKAEWDYTWEAAEARYKNEGKFAYFSRKIKKIRGLRGKIDEFLAHFLHNNKY